ncbi:four helix bundle protein [Winogradskyella undariae]|uniref:four helix bundle protein n=1 Tax=Winogradskyella TaxID=286104 RepID=UPI00156AF351|nr:MULTISPECIES: four helix bundle protein [Winogradskyella]NRR92660.1 four helix bundle protein [Winogradskyella undariae]QNK78068.1 four helix bundle protein [Winogradskyella sp. PAMC22761]QXP78922.1 four helix bundle protein [Winogradskyella sp. HaHa_3_26]
MHRFKDLEIWKKSRVFCSSIYGITSKFPESEKFGLTNQLRRASVSIPSNIAEGSSRNSNKDFSRFLQITLGSAYEVETQLLIASDLNFISKEELDKLLLELNSIIKMTSKFKSTLN